MNYTITCINDILSERPSNQLLLTTPILGTPLVPSSQ